MNWQVIWISIAFAALAVLNSAQKMFELSPHEETAFFRGMGSQRYVVLILNRWGLANRLRSMADWYQIAQLSNRTLLVSWAATADCNATFFDLFESGPPGMHILSQTLPKGDEGIALVEKMAKDRHISTLPLYSTIESQIWAEPLNSFVLAQRIAFADNDVIITTYDGIISLEGTRCRHYMTMHSQFLQKLVPIAETRKLVQEVKDMHFTNKVMVGIHFRAHDEMQDWAVTPPLVEGTVASKFGIGSTFEDFKAVMAEVQNHFSYTDGASGQLKTLVRFFVASNNHDMKLRLQRLTEDAVALSGDYDRASVDGVRFALAEWLLLSESALVINSYGSSFAHEASQRHMRPLVGIWEHQLVHHSSMALPYCGHLQFVKAEGIQGVPASFVEGHRRKIESVAVPLKESSILAEWGLRRVLTTIDDTTAMGSNADTVVGISADYSATSSADHKSVPAATDDTGNSSDNSSGRGSGSGSGSGSTHRSEAAEDELTAGGGGGGSSSAEESATSTTGSSTLSLEGQVAFPYTKNDADFSVFGLKHGTDKLEHHGYHRYYPRFIEHYRPVEGAGMLEIGVQFGYSLNMWLEYFPHAFIYGVDIDIQKSGDRFHIFKGDQGSLPDMTRLMETVVQHPLFLIVDDGSHLPFHQLVSFDYLFPKLLPGGTYIIEDIEMSYWKRDDIHIAGYRMNHGLHSTNAAMEVFKALADDVNWEFLSPLDKHKQDNHVGKRSYGGEVVPTLSKETREHISSVTFGQNCVIITKKTAEEYVYIDRKYRFPYMWPLGEIADSGDLLDLTEAQRLQKEALEL